MIRLLALILIIYSPCALAADINQEGKSPVVGGWSEIDSANDSPGPNGWNPAMSDGYIRGTGRMMMGAIKRWHDHTNCTATAGGSANEQTLSYPVAPPKLALGDVYCYWIKLTNTNAVTLSINGMAPVPIITGGGETLRGGELVAGAPVMETFDGSNFRLFVK